MNFFWSEKGYKWVDGAPIECIWEDVYYSVLRDDKLIREGGVTVETRKYFQYEIDSLKGDLGERMEVRYPGYVEEELNSTHYGIPLKDLPNSDIPRWCFSYDDPESEDFYQIDDMINLHKNENGILPCYITGYIPEEILNRKSVETFMVSYINKFFGIDEKMEFYWEDVPSDDYLEKEYQKSIKEAEEWTKNREKGITPKIMLLPQPMSMFIGKEKVEELLKRGFTQAEQIEGTDEFLYHFEDGHTETSGGQIDLSDHFSDPEEDWK